MQDQWLWVAVSVAEVLFVLAALLLVSWIRNSAARRRDRQAVRALVAATRAGKDERVAEISAFVASNFGLTGDALARTVRAIYRAEVRLIQIFANTYLERNASVAANFGRPVRESTDPYWELAPGGASASADADVADQQEEQQAQADADAAEETVFTNEAEVARLRGENTRLSEELKVTMDTMSRMLNEYSTVFAKEGEIGDITVQEEHLVDEALSEPADEDGQDAVQEEVEAAPEGEVSGADGVAAAARPEETGSAADGQPETVDPDDILASSQRAAAGSAAPEVSVTSGAAEAGAGVQGAASAADPDALPADAQHTGSETDDMDLSDDSRFVAEIDTEMKDLSADDESEPADEVTQQQAKRQQVIDAES